MASQDSTTIYSVAQNDFTNTENLWRTAFKEIQPLLSALAAESANPGLAKAYAEALKQSQGQPQSWAQTGWRKTLAQVLGKYIELTKVESWDWPVMLARPGKFKPLQAMSWSCQVNPEETLHLAWIKNSCLIAVTDDLTFLEGAIRNHISLIIPPNANSSVSLRLKAWIWDKHNFLLPGEPGN